MVDELTALLQELDAWVEARDTRPLTCYLLGGGAMQLSHGSPRRTKDLDIVGEPLGEHAKGIAEAFGRDTGRAPYIDVVTAGLPVLATGWRQRAVAFDGPWPNLIVRILAPIDQVVSKLKSFRPHDRRDIQLVCDLHPEIRDPLAALGVQDFWTATDLREEVMAARRDLVVEYLDGGRDGL